MYVTLTAPVIFAQPGQYKIAKRKYAQNLEKDIIYNIVLLCNGDAKKAKRIVYQNTS
jgi:hypothetical protein